MEVGPTGSGAMGPVPLTHSELLAWQVNMRRMLQPWEIDVLRRLSMQWCAESDEAQDDRAPAPWTPERIPVEELNRVASGLRATLRGMAGKK